MPGIKTLLISNVIFETETKTAMWMKEKETHSD